MFLPQSYETALLFMVGSMLCWGSWANSMKLCPGYRFQLFYWDYIVGLIVGILFWGLTLGSVGAGPHFLSDVAAAPAASILLAMLSGAVLQYRQPTSRRCNRDRRYGCRLPHWYRPSARRRSAK